MPRVLLRERCCDFDGVSMKAVFLFFVIPHLVYVGVSFCRCALLLDTLIFSSCRTEAKGDFVRLK